MADITITIGDPVERPAVEAKTFPDFYVLDLAINAREAGPSDSLYINGCPYHKASGERLLSDQKEARLNLWATVQKIPGMEDHYVPEAAAAYKAIADAIPAIYAKQAELMAKAESALDNPPP